MININKKRFELIIQISFFISGVDYVTYVPKIENNTIKIGHFIHKCKFSTFIILDGCKSRIIRNSIKLIISLNLSTSNKKILRKFNNKK